MSLSQSAKPASVLDRIVYLASLASNPRDVDSILDKLRFITARLASAGTASPLSAKDETELVALQQQLEDYLLHHDRLRSFTPESLKLTMDEHFVSSRFRNLHRSMQILWALVLLAAAAGFGLAAGLGATVRLQVAVITVFLVLSAGTIYLFGTALRGFNKELRPAFTLICLNVLVSGLAQVQLPIIAYFHLSSSPIFRYGGFVVPYALAMILMYLGVRIYARIVGISHWAMRWLPVTAGAAVLAGVIVFAPHASHPHNELFFMLSVVSLAIQGYTAMLSAILVVAIIRKIAPFYRRAMKWLLVVLVLSMLSSYQYAAYIYFQGELLGTTQTAAVIPFVVLSCMVLQTGYSFKKTSLD